MVEKKEIESIFSKELQLIKNQELKNKVIKVWKEASDRGKWESLDNVPFTLLFENSGKLTDHTKRITKLAKSILDNREEKLNQDYLIAGALLHDVGKLLEYKYVNGKYVKSEFGKKFRHPVSGALLAKELGLPDEVVFIIYAHSHEGDELKRSPEAIIINHCDFID
ncbi:MAG: HD domain-containing protein, partial [Thermoplasmatota archaeon]